MTLRGIWNCPSAVVSFASRRITHLDRPARIHVRQADFEIGDQSRAPLSILSTASAKKAREKVVWVPPATLLLRFVLLQALLAMSIIYRPCLIVSSTRVPQVQLTSDSDRISYATLVSYAVFSSYLLAD